MRAEHWVDVTAGGQRVRHPLREGLTRVGAPGCDVVVPGAGSDELHFWSDPPKVLRVGEATAPLLNGRAFDAADLSSGDSIQWGNAVLVYGREQATVIEELSSVVQPTPTAPAEGLDRFTLRLRAGVLADLGLADPRATKLWREAVLRGEFDADACARDLLGPDVPGTDDARLLERASRLQRDLLMMPLQRGVRGAGRRARGATRRGAAYLVANLIAITVYSLVLVAIMVLVRINYAFSFDRVIDGFLGIFK